MEFNIVVLEENSFKNMVYKDKTNQEGIIFILDSKMCFVEKKFKVFLVPYILDYKLFEDEKYE